MTVTNDAALPTAVRFPSGQRFDAQLGGDGGVLWTWSATRLFVQALGEERLGPGETLTYTADVPAGAVTAGTLAATGILTSSSHPLNAQVAIAVGP